MIDATSKAIVLIDDECVLCNVFARYLVKHDKKDIFRIGSLFSENGKEIINSFNGKQPDESVVLVWNNVVYFKSEAVLKILLLLGGWHRVIGVFYILPKYIRDFFYNIISKNRYRILGKSVSCPLPDEKYKSKFIF